MDFLYINQILWGKCDTADMSNQQLVDHGNHMMDETDQAIDRAKKVC